MRLLAAVLLGAAACGFPSAGGVAPGDGPAPGVADAATAVVADGPAPGCGLNSVDEVLACRVASIDLAGDGAEFAGAPAVTLDLAASPANALFVTGYQPSMSATLRAVHDGTTLAFEVDVVDDDVMFVETTPDNSTWFDDAVAWYFDFDGDNSGPLTADDREVVVDAGGELQAWAATVPVEGAEFGRRATSIAGGFRLRLSVELTAPGRLALGQDTLGFSFGLFDNDGCASPSGAHGCAYGLWRAAVATCQPCCTGPRAEAWCDSTFYRPLRLAP